jgi:polyvinyl alcohol dehydrogenase (cytochrome)
MKEVAAMIHRALQSIRRFGLCCLPLVTILTLKPVAAEDLPANWAVYGGNSEHNSDYTISQGAAAEALNRGVSWQFAEEGALPLDLVDGKDADVLGPRSAPVKTTQFLGNAVGVTVVGDTVFAESDAGFVYALDAVTGRLRWRARVDNAAMGNPIVVDGRVFVGSGDTGFAFSQVMRAMAGETGPLVRGLSWAGVYAFDAKDGKQLWRFGTPGENMPSQCYSDGALYFANGDGHFYSLDPATGKANWITDIGGFDSMSSCLVVDGKVVAGFTDPNNLVAVDAKTGAIAQRTDFPNVANTGMGDNSPTFERKDDEIIQVAVTQTAKGAQGDTVDLGVFAVDPVSGVVRWKTLLGHGAMPPAFKASVPMSHDGVIYVSDPATNTLSALSGNDGSVRWKSSIPHTYPTGLGRGAVTYHEGVIYQATGAYIYAWDAQTGKLRHELTIGGRFGIINPVIVGQTIFLANSWGWIMALPLSEVGGQMQRRVSLTPRVMP